MKKWRWFGLTRLEFLFSFILLTILITFSTFHFEDLRRRAYILDVKSLRGTIVAVVDAVRGNAMVEKRTKGRNRLFFSGAWIETEQGYPAQSKGGIFQAVKGEKRGFDFVERIPPRPSEIRFKRAHDSGRCLLYYSEPTLLSPRPKVEMVLSGC